MITGAKDPKWVNAKHEQIIFQARINESVEWVSFVADPGDCTDYGPALYQAALDGEYGEIAPSDEELMLGGEMPPPEGYEVQKGGLVNVAALEQEAGAELNRRLAELQTPECLAEAELDEEYAAWRKEKLAALLAVRKQKGWPMSVKWPEAGK